jgi:hypothetical protein
MSASNWRACSASSRLNDGRDDIRHGHKRRETGEQFLPYGGLVFAKPKVLQQGDSPKPNDRASWPNAKLEPRHKVREVTRRESELGD